MQAAVPGPEGEAPLAALRLVCCTAGEVLGRLVIAFSGMRCGIDAHHHLYKTWSTELCQGRWANADGLMLSNQNARVGPK